MAKLVQMTAGAGLFPADPDVDRLWIEMDAAAHQPRGGQGPPGWSLALRTGGDFGRRREAVLEAMRRGPLGVGEWFGAGGGCGRSRPRGWTRSSCRST